MKQYQLLYSNEVLLEGDRTMRLDYSLTEKKSEMDDLTTPYYGVRIVKHQEDIKEEDEIAGISESRDQVVLLIKKLCQYQVTPVSMVEIIDELIGQGV